VLLPSEPHRKLIMKADVLPAWLEALTATNSSSARGAALLGLQVGALGGEACWAAVARARCLGCGGWGQGGSAGRCAHQASSTHHPQVLARHEPASLAKIVAAPSAVATLVQEVRRLHTMSLAPGEAGQPRSAPSAAGAAAPGAAACSTALPPPSALPLA
jgi:hypothetical protein